MVNLEAEKSAPLIYPSEDRATNADIIHECVPISFSAND